MGEWKPPMMVTSSDLIVRARSYVLRIASPGERTEQKKPIGFPLSMFGSPINVTVGMLPVSAHCRNSAGKSGAPGS